MAELRFLNVADVLNITSFSESTLWRKVKAGTFPKPVTLSKRRVGWREADVMKWADKLDGVDRQDEDRFTRIARRLADGELKGQIVLGGPRQVNLMPRNSKVVFKQNPPEE